MNRELGVTKIAPSSQILRTVSGLPSQRNLSAISSSAFFVSSVRTNLADRTYSWCLSMISAVSSGNALLSVRVEMFSTRAT